MYDEEYESEIIEQDFDDTGVIYEKPIELDIFAEDAWDDSALLAAFHKSLKMHPEANDAKNETKDRTSIIGSTPLSVRTTVSPSSSNAGNNRGRQTRKLHSKVNNVDANINDDNSKKNAYNKTYNHGNNNNNGRNSSLKQEEHYRQSAFPENNNIHEVRSPSATRHPHGEQQRQQEQYPQHFRERAMHQSSLSPPPPMHSQHRGMYQSPSLLPPPMQPVPPSPIQPQQQHQHRNQYYQDQAYRAAAGFHNNYYNTSPTYMYQQQHLPQRVYKQVPSPPPQQQAYHPIHLDKELADLLLSWYQSGYQAGRYHAFREMNSSSTNGYNYANFDGRGSPSGTNINSGSPYQQR